MPDAEVLVADDGPVRTITLNRPDRLNALLPSTVAGLADALEAAAEPGIRVVVLRGAGRGFCSGADLREARPGPVLEPGLVSVIDHGNRAVRAMQTMPQPVVAAVHGPAVGMGCSFATAADLVIAAESASFGLPFADIALMPDGGASVLVPASLGRTRAMTMALLGDRVSAAEAYAWGLVSRLVPDDAFEAEVTAVVARLAAGAPLALAATKRAVNAATLPDLDHRLDAEKAGQSDLLVSEDVREAVAAFRDRRPPRFTGR